MFSKLFGCCAKGTYSAELYEFEDERNCAIDMLARNDSAEKVPSPNKKRGGFFRWHRLTKEEQILRYEKRYLKKFLRHYRMYVTGMTMEQMRMARRLVTMTMLGGGESPSTSQDRREEKNFCAYCCHCFGCAGRRDSARKAIATADPNPVDGKELAEGQVTDSTGAPMPSRIIAEAKRVVDQIRKENALKQMGSPETVVANDQGQEKTTADEAARESNTEMQKDQEIEPSQAVEILTNDDKRPSAEEADPENAESEPESEEDDEMLGFIGRGRYISFDQPDCDVSDCNNL